MDDKPKNSSEEPLNRRLLAFILDLTVGGCTCNVKTPETKYHSGDCKYRLAMETFHYIRDLEQRLEIAEEQNRNNEAGKMRLAEVFMCSNEPRWTWIIFYAKQMQGTIGQLRDELADCKQALDKLKEIKK